MEIIKSIIIDDEPGNIITLSELLKAYCPEVIVAATAPDPLQGKEIIELHKPQLVFLDIEMPYGNAFDLLDMMKPVTFEVIFITAFNQYAIQAFKYAAIDYILKPVNISDLQNAVQKVSNRLMERNVNARILNLLNNIKPENAGLQKIALPTAEGLSFEDISHISHFEAAGSYTKVYLSDSRKNLVTKTLKEFEDILPDSVFYRIHHSFIVNMNFITKYYKGRGGYIEMKDGTTIEVATRKKNGFLERFMGKSLN